MDRVRKISKGMQCYSCDNCSGDYFRFPSQVRGVNKTCSKSCYHDLIKKIGKFSSINNPNYKDGKYCTPAVCECGREMDYRAKACAVCTNRSVPIRPEYRKTDQEIIDLLPVCFSYSEIANKIKTSRKRVVSVIKKHNLDISHFVACRDRPKSNEEVFKLRTEGFRSGLPRKVILEQDLLEYKCSLCGLEDEWNGMVLTLELDHINGNRLDDRLENLRFLCPNCHACTPTYKGKNIGGIYE